jgi:conflict system STAND superfamily ATPase
VPPLNRAPYPGLRAFRREETDLFFGRDDCIEIMIERLRAARFLAVLGSSGTGKSSLVKTGLLAGLEMGLLAGAGSSWRIVDFRPGGAPLRNLARRLLETERAEAGHAPADLDDTAVGLLHARLRRGPRSLIEWCRDGHLPDGVNLLVLVDQFEELFRYPDYAQREEAEAFVALLLESAHPTEVARGPAANPPIYVTITMRSEYLGACALIEGLAEAINEGIFLTPRMTREQCREAMVGPARVCGIEIEDPLVNRLLNDLAAFAPWDDREGQDAVQLSRLARRADQLPLMQHALNQMWERARQRQAPGPDTIVLTLGDYKGLKEELNAHANRVLADLGPERRPVAETVFRTVTAGTTAADATRRPTPFSALVEICGGHEHRDAVRAVVDAFRAPGCNFLLPEADAENRDLRDGTIVDISHESLIRQWATLSGWLEREGRAAQEWRRLGERAERYREGTDELLSGRRLAAALAARDEIKPNAAWAKHYGIDFDRVRGFLAESVRAQRFRRTRLAVLGAVAGSLLVVASARMFEASVKEQASRKEAEANRTIAEASRKQAEASRKEADASRKEADASRREAEASRKESEASKEAIQLTQRAIAVAAGELQLSQRETAAREREAKRSSEEADRNRGYRDAAVKTGDSFEPMLRDIVDRIRADIQTLEVARPKAEGDTRPAREATAAADAGDSALSGFRKANQNLVEVVAEIARLLERFRAVEPDNPQLVRPHMTTLALLSVLRTDRHGSRALAERKQAFDLADTLARQGMDAKSAESVYYQMSTVAAALDDDGKHPETLAALDKLISMLTSFIGSVSGLAPSDAERAEGWTARAFLKKGEILVKIDRPDDAVAAFQAGLARLDHVPIDHQWRVVTVLHQKLSDRFSARARLTTGASAVQARAQAIQHLRRATEATQPNFPVRFQNTLPLARDAAAWPGRLRWVVDDLRDGKLGEAWNDLSKEADVRFALIRSDWLARLHADLGALYETAKDLPAARASYALEVIQRFRLIAGDEAMAREHKHDNETAKRGLATALKHLGVLEFSRGYKSNAAAFYRDCAEVMQLVAARSRESAPVNDETLGECQVGRGNALRRLNQYADGRPTYDDAAASYRAALASFERASRRGRDQRFAINDAQFGLVVSLTLGGHGGEAEPLWTRYRQSSRDRLDAARKAYETSRADGPRAELVGALGSVSMAALIDNDPSGAAQHAEEALKLSRAPLAWIEINLAHAYLLLGRVSEARELYSRRLKEEASYLDDVTEDFQLFRKRGSAVAVMDDIEREFGIR